MTKKQKILDLFNSIEWFKSPSGILCKIIKAEDFSKIGLYHCIENNSQYCDIIYAKRVIQSLGHRVLFGSQFFVYKDSLLTKKNSIKLK